LRDKRNIEKTVSALSLIFLLNVKRQPLLGFSSRKCLFNSQTNTLQRNYILLTTDLYYIYLRLKNSIGDLFVSSFAAQNVSISHLAYRLGSDFVLACKETKFVYYLSSV
jgi:hypothetical protein